MMQKVIDLSGQTFGKITVIKLNKVENGTTHWECFCSCNPEKTFEFTWHRIKDRKFPNCGCSNTSWKRNNHYDLTGEYGVGHIGDIEFYFDLEDYDKIKDTSWFISTKNYIRGKINNKSIPIHRLIVDCPKGLVVDHINGNKHDNRKINLRITTNQGNTQNKINKIKNTTSKYFGVRKVASGRWNASIKTNQVAMYLGTFATEEEAALAYNKKAEDLGFLTKNIIEYHAN